MKRREPTRDLRSHQMVSLRTLAKLWDCHPASVRRILARAGVPAYLLGGGRKGMVRFRLSDVKEFVDGSALTPGQLHPFRN